jgi:hypothetical protein
MKKLIVAGALAVLTIGAGGTAFAGEGTGSGMGGPNGDGKTGAYSNSNSECASSGLEDGNEPGTVAGPGNTQNWGQIPMADRDFLRSIGVAPSTLCNGHLSPRK